MMNAVVLRCFSHSIPAGNVRRRLSSDVNGIRSWSVRQTGGRRCLESVSHLPRLVIVIIIIIIIIIIVITIGWRRTVVVSALALINVVNRHWARLLLGWVTARGQGNRLGLL